MLIRSLGLKNGEDPRTLCNRIAWTRNADFDRQNYFVQGKLDIVIEHVVMIDKQERKQRSEELRLKYGCICA